MAHKVMICLPTGEFARRADFYDYLNMIEKPEGTMFTASHGSSPAKNRNIMIKMALEQGASHIFFVDDDMAFKPDTLMKLLSHDVDIVSGLYLLRNYPHLPLMFDEAYEDGKCKYAFLDPSKGGLTEVVNIGLGCALIKIDVFKKIEEPWITLGHPEKDGWCDDIDFFNRCRKAGYKIHVDLDVRCGHMAMAILWPDRDEQGNWYTMYDTSGAAHFRVPQINPTKEEINSNLEAAGVK